MNLKHLRYCLYEKDLKESQTHKNTANTDRNDKKIRSFMITHGNTTPIFKSKKSILNNMSKTAKRTITITLFNHAVLRRNNRFHVLFSDVSQNFACVIIEICKD